MKEPRELMAKVGKRRFAVVDRQLSWKHIYSKIDAYNATQDQPKYRIRAGVRSTLIYLFTTYMGQVDAGKAQAGFFETSTALIADSIHQSDDSALRHLKRLKEIGWLKDYNTAGPASNFGHASNLKIQLADTSWERHLSTSLNSQVATSASV